MYLLTYLLIFRCRIFSLLLLSLLHIETQLVLARSSFWRDPSFTPTYKAFHPHDGALYLPPRLGLREWSAPALLLIAKITNLSPSGAQRCAMSLILALKVEGQGHGRVKVKCRPICFCFAWNQLSIIIIVSGGSRKVEGAFDQI